MLIRVSSVSFAGIETIGIDVEINIAQTGLPAFDIVGLPNKAVGESRERVRTALINGGFRFPLRKITVNLAPGDVPKDGAFYDLPIAAGILSAVKGVTLPPRSIFFGELSLDGSLRHTRGALNAALYAREQLMESIFLPEASANEAAVVSGLTVTPLRDLNQLFRYLSGEGDIEPAVYAPPDESAREAAEFDMAEILGQEQAKRALEIAAAGGHNIMLTGSPGSGKTMLARALPGILPLLSEGESLEVTKIYSCTGHTPPGSSLIIRRPFRAPHHIISQAGLVGGGSNPQPGEISLAHRGVLFLDEFNEFPRSVIEALRQPMEDGKLTIARSRQRVTYPSRFILVAAANPCPCGYLYDDNRDCVCTPKEIARYRKKLSGPILDRIDMHVEVPVVESDQLAATLGPGVQGEPSEEIRKRIGRARDRQRERMRDEEVFTNAEMRNSMVRRYISLGPAVQAMLTEAAGAYSLSARSYLKIIKLSRTIADLDSTDEITETHIAEALQFRPEIEL